MTRTMMFALAASASFAAPALAQTASDDRRFETAQSRFDSEMAAYRNVMDRSRGGYNRNVNLQSARDRFDNELNLYRQEIDRYQSAVRSTRGYTSRPYNSGTYNNAPVTDGTYYDPSRDYRDGNYEERTVLNDERVYRGTDGRYYCKRSDGTTGLIVGGLAGGVLGNVIDGGSSRVLGTLLGGVAGALGGRAIERSANDRNGQVRCK